MVVKFRIYLFEDKEMNKYNFRKEIRWKITSVITILSYSENATKANQWAQ